MPASSKIERVIMFSLPRPPPPLMAADVVLLKNNMKAAQTHISQTFNLYVREPFTLCKHVCRWEITLTCFCAACSVRLEIKLSAGE